MWRYGYSWTWIWQYVVQMWFVSVWCVYILFEHLLVVTTVFELFTKLCAVMKFLVLKWCEPIEVPRSIKVIYSNSFMNMNFYLHKNNKRFCHCQQMAKSLKFTIATHLSKNLNLHWQISGHSQNWKNIEKSTFFQLILKLVHEMEWKRNYLNIWKNV